MTKLLINEPPLQVLPSLAALVGLNEALFLQQLHYWTSNPKIGVEVDGARWVRNTVAEWQVDNFPFWSLNTIRRTVANLEDAGLIMTRSDLNSLNYDKTKWYSIDYVELEATTQIGQSVESPQVAAKATTQIGQPSTQIGQPSTQIGYIELPNLGNAIPETTSETTSEIDGDAAPPAPAEASPEMPEDTTDRRAAIDALQAMGLFNATDLARFDDLWPELAGRRDWIGRAITATRDAGPRAPIPYVLKILANSVHTNTPPGRGNGRAPANDYQAKMALLFDEA